MDRLIHIVLSGIRQTAGSQRTTMANLANVNTVGFKADETAGFHAQYLGQRDDPTTRAYTVNAPPYVDGKVGAMVSTGNPLDVTIDGPGYFVVQASDGSRVITRRGDFRVGANGNLINGADDVVIGDNGPIVIPPYRDLSIGNDGTVSVVPLDAPTDAVPTVLGRLGLIAAPVQVRRREDGNLEPASGPIPAFDPNVFVTTGRLESSNVNSVDILARMVELSRLFEAQTRLLKIASTLDESGASLMRTQE